MLESQKTRLHERSRLRAQGLTDEQIRQTEASQLYPFRPAFDTNGKRLHRDHSGEGAAPAGTLAMRPTR